VTGATILPESFPVQGVVFNTLVEATVSNITARPISNGNVNDGVNKNDSTNDGNSPGKDSGFDDSL
jgi:hypothetical protein